MRIGLLLIALMLAGCSGGGGTNDQPGPDTAAPADIAAGVDTPAGVDTEPAEDTFVPPEDCTQDWECDDKNPCTTDACVDGDCSYGNAQGTCDDDDACTVGDQCVGGQCLGSPMDCADDNDCTDDECVAGACKHPISSSEACALQIEITLPARAATLIGNKVQTVKGRVISPAGDIKKITINGQPTTPDSQGYFDVIHEAVVGINILRGETTDEFGRKATTIQSFAFAENLHTPGAPGDVTLLPDSSQAWIGHPVFDDDDVGDLDDMATLAYDLLTYLDFNDFIPHPVIPQNGENDFLWCEWEVDVQDLSYDVGEVEITPVSGGLFLEGSLNNLSAYLSAVASYCPDALGYAYADKVSIEAKLLVDAEDGQFDMELEYVNVSIQGVEIDITEGTGSFFDWAFNWFSDSFTGLIEDELEVWIPDTLIPMLVGLIDDFTTYEVEFHVPTIPGNAPGIPIALGVQAGDVNFNSQGASLSLNVGTASQDLVEHNCPGSLARGDCAGTSPSPFVLPKADEVEAALGEDLLNQILFSLWRGGHMNLLLNNDLLGPLVDGLGLSGLVVQLDPHLPPVITTCSTDGDLEVQIGDLNLWASFTMNGAVGEVELFASVRVQVSPQVILADSPPNHVSLKIQEVKDMGVEILSTEGVVEGSEALIEALLSAAVVDVLIGEYISSAVASYPIPSVDAGEYIPGIPQGSHITFNPMTLMRLNGFLVIGGEILPL